MVASRYNPAGRLTALTHAGRAWTFAHDGVGRRASATFPNSTTATYAYDPAGRLTALTHADAAGTRIQQLAYTYDPVGHRLTKADLQGRARYAYDAAHRLAVVRQPRPAPPRESFTYDLVGNRLDSTPYGAAVFNAGHQLLEDAAFTYAYDAQGNRTRQTATADGAVTTYAYDAEHHLVRVVLPTGLTASSTYDALGRRIAKTVRQGATTTVTQYVYDHEDIVLERDGAGTITARYTHGPGIDEPLLVEQDGQAYVYHADGLGSIVALTDANGEVVQRYTYTAFGTIAAQGDANFVQPYTFTGREFDADTGLYYYRARTYDAATGRFLQRDPIGFAGGDLNLYGYVFQNPINGTDPSGLRILLRLPYYNTPEGFAKLLDEWGLGDLPQWLQELLYEVCGNPANQWPFVPGAGLGMVRAGGGGRVNKLGPVSNAPHTVFKRNSQTGRVTGYTEFDAIGNPIKRFRGEGGPHGGLNPPFILEPKSGKGRGAPPKVPRLPRADELPSGY